MKFVIAFVICFAVATFAAPQHNLETEVIEYLFKNPGNGEYQFKVALSDGQSRSETGHVVHAGAEDEHIAVEGEFEWKWEDKVYHVKYFADEKGYHAVGDHIAH